jgi:DNA-binding protein HU-beta
MANKADLIDKVASKSGLTKKDATAAVESLFDTVTETLSEGERVQIIGFGSFEVRDRAARKGRNPQTGEEIEIPATKVPAFKAGKGLKDAVKENA